MRADPEHEVNQAVARSQTEDCYREIPRDSIWSEVRGWKIRLRSPTVPRESERESRVGSNESIDSFRKPRGSSFIGCHFLRAMYPLFQFATS